MINLDQAIDPKSLNKKTDTNNLDVSESTVTRIPRKSTLINSDVTHVTDVTTRNGGPSSGNATESTNVTNVTEIKIPSKDKCPAFVCFDQWIEEGGNKLSSGVWHFEVNKDGEIIRTKVCSPLHIEAVTYDRGENNYGRLLRFKTTKKTLRKWAMPMELLKGSGDELRGELLAMGVLIQPGIKTRNLLSMYLQSNPPKLHIQCALQVGWCGNSFVLPDKVYGQDADKIIFQSGERTHDEYTTAGTLKEWQKNIAAFAIDNLLLTLAISTAFTGALLQPCHAESGGIHFVGESSTGKSTCGIAASSVWGGENYKRSWRTTSNGLEGAAMLFNDGLLVLDEIGECDPREVGAIVYSLGNGKGKQRANRSGNARGVNSWKCFVLSNGEKSIPTIMSEGGARYNAGQSVRLLDLPVERQHGVFDTLHQFNTGAELSDWIKKQSAIHYGLAGRLFLEKLTKDKRDFNESLQKIKESKLFQASGAQGQHKRAAARFALIALAGELATEYGITGWSKGTAFKAAAEGFRIWCNTRGQGNDEKRQILDQVLNFIERHGDSRFSSLNNTANITVRDRAGWWTHESETRIYLFTAGGMKEALKGFDLKRSLDILVSVGALPEPKTTNGERSKQRKIDGKNTKVYEINAEKLSNASGEF